MTRRESLAMARRAVNEAAPLTKHGPELHREAWPLPLVFVLEKDVRLAPRLPLHALRPRFQLRSGVFGTAQTHVSPRRGRHDQRVNIRDFIRVGRAKSDVA